ncbi:uncharacterized protein N7446_010488 [Penicillium canescens]|uniref:AMP-dependent synthetase/ligase domain-containing protein n=1 Tax=Penicillium canescens TaxID=5083 RepID=A0AAD6ICP1_PENCN|nr:uncharacterized protein N7446_010488 [Penicillium canescens]KAJ6041632.1 hypothetical protein N7460_007022 [Penicillium canescens]KAJ6050379.1 hypothetical protein N7446_010488 [Penicillium canescens]KAJ6064681.1 hypothetical protein N7444_000334 [Penicillium canescens]
MLNSISGSLRSCILHEEGEILIRNVIAKLKGYMDNELTDHDLYGKGWVHTGDYGYLDEDCNVVVVVGVRNTELQVDEPMASVVLKEPVHGKTVQIIKEIEHAKSKLTGLRRLTGAMYFVPKYPTTGFKINQRELKSMVPSLRALDAMRATIVQCS